MRLLRQLEVDERLVVLHLEGDATDGALLYLDSRVRLVRGKSPIIEGSMEDNPYNTRINPRTC
jgi:hypothetical protein